MNKDANAVLDFTQDWSKWLIDGDTITESTWNMAPLGLVVEDSTHDDKTATMWVSGGVVGTTYKATNRITTAQGRVDERSIPIKVINR